MAEKAAHTPLPWWWSGTLDRKGSIGIYAKAGIQECLLATLTGALATDATNAEFIVRAVNSHAQLLEALEEIMPLAQTGYSSLTSNASYHQAILRRARAAISAAKETG